MFCSVFQNDERVGELPTLINYGEPFGDTHLLCDFTSPEYYGSGFRCDNGEIMRNSTRTFIPTHNNLYSHVTRQEKEIFYLTWRVFGLFLLVPERSMRRFHSEPPSSQLALWIGFSRKPVRIILYRFQQALFLRHFLPGGI